MKPFDWEYLGLECCTSNLYCRANCLNSWDTNWVPWYVFTVGGTPYSENIVWRILIRCPASDWSVSLQQGTCWSSRQPAGSGENDTQICLNHSKLGTSCGSCGSFFWAGLYFMHTSHNLTAFLTSSEIAGQKIVSRALNRVFSSPKWPAWRSFRYSALSEVGITSRCALNIRPSSTASSSR